MSREFLDGTTIVVTRPECRAAALKTRLQELGAKVLAVPTIRFSPVADSDPWDRVLEDRNSFSHVIFSSRTAVDTFTALCTQAGMTPDSWLRNCSVAAIGASTAAGLDEAGLGPVLVSSGSTGAEFARELIEKENPRPGDRILLPGSEIARGELAAALRQSGAQVEEVAIYRTCMEEPARAAPLLESLDRGETPQGITFASPSALNGFLDLCGQKGRQMLEKTSVKIISIGPTTSEAIRAQSLEVSAQAARATTEAVVDALEEALGR